MIFPEPVVRDDIGRFLSTRKRDKRTPIEFDDPDTRNKYHLLLANANLNLWNGRERVNMNEWEGGVLKSGHSLSGAFNSCPLHTDIVRHRYIFLQFTFWPQVVSTALPNSLYRIY